MVTLAACARAISLPGFGSHYDALDLHQYLAAYLVAVWLVTDPKLPRAERPSFDHAFLHMSLFPILAIYEQVRVHRWRGVAMILGLVIFIFLPIAVDAIATTI